MSDARYDRRFVALWLAIPAWHGAPRRYRPAARKSVCGRRAGPSTNSRESDQVFRDTVGCVSQPRADRARATSWIPFPGTREESRILFSFHSRMQSCFDNYQAGRQTQSSLPEPLLCAASLPKIYLPPGVPGRDRAGGRMSPSETMTAWAGSATGRRSGSDPNRRCCTPWRAASSCASPRRSRQCSVPPRQRRGKGRDARLVDGARRLPRFRRRVHRLAAVAARPAGRSRAPLWRGPAHRLRHVGRGSAGTE